MVSMIIYLLGFLSVALVAGVFIVALTELNAIDEASSHSSTPVSDL